jgi:hypothetical protein
MAIERFSFGGAAKARKFVYILIPYINFELKTILGGGQVSDLPPLPYRNLFL